MSENLFIGVYPGGLVYADRSREEHGDYARVAFLPYDTLQLEVSAPCSDLLADVQQHAATVQARRGEQYEVSACGQTVLLGSAAPEPASDRDATIVTIRAALKRRSGKAWSVTGGKGTAWGWITIDAQPARRTWRHRLKSGSCGDIPENYEEYDSGERGGCMGPADRAELAQLLGLDCVHQQGEDIAASRDHRREYIDRAEGRTPAKIAEPYWD